MITKTKWYTHGTLAMQISETNIETIEKDIVITVDGIKKKYYLDSATWDGFSSCYLLTYKEYDE